MGFIKLNRYGDPNGCAFDATAVVEQARQTFTNVNVIPGDQLALSADRAVAAGEPEHIVGRLRRNQQDYGPAYAFEIALNGGGTIQGRARPCDVTFLFTDPLAEDWHQRLLAFLKALGPGRIEQAADEFAR